jgi:hypothetical protein
MNTIQTNTPEEIEQMFKTAPKVFTAAVRSWLIRERNSFVGKRGAFVKELLSKQRKYRPGQWSQFVASAFGGRVENENNLNNMHLRMGIRDERLEKLPYLEALGKGAKINPKDAQWLIIPNYKNLMAVGLFGRYGGRGKRSFNKLFKKMYDSDLTIVQRRGRLFFFGDTPDAGGSHEIRHKHELNRKLLFVGVKSVTIPQQFNFGASWQKRLPKVLQRGEKAIAKAVEKIEKGKVAYERL